MADERDEEQFGQAESEKKQTMTGQHGQQSEFGEQRGQAATGQAGSGSEPPRSMGTRGEEFGQSSDGNGSGGQQGQSGMGQSDLGTQSDTTLAGRSDQQDRGQDQPGRTGGAQGEGFIGSQRSGSDEHLQGGSAGGAGDSSGAGATGGPDLASQGRGALEGEEEDLESGRSRVGNSDIERP
jgi:hypothetical protein